MYHEFVFFVILSSSLCRGHEKINEIFLLKKKVKICSKTEQFLQKNVTTILDDHKDDETSVVESYENAVQYYLDDDWDSCIQGFETFNRKYKAYKNRIIECRKKCRREAENISTIFHENIEDLHFYEKKTKETLCLLQCNHEQREIYGKNSMKRIPEKMEWNFALASHHEYLHNCYYQKKFYQKAANSVFTYLIYHPNHKLSKDSLAFYMNLEEVNKNAIRNLEADPYVDYYANGVEAYKKELYHEALLKFESSLASFIDSEEKCRFYCEGPYEMNWNPEFVTSLSNHFVYNLRCKRRCSRILSTLNGEYRSDILKNHYHYLQYIYYKLDKLKKACQAVESYLLFHPSDETMLSNKDFYLTLPNVTDYYFEPREEAITYVKRQEYEKRLLLYVDQKFQAFEEKINVSK